MSAGRQAAVLGWSGSRNVWSESELQSAGAGRRAGWSQSELQSAGAGRRGWLESVGAEVGGAGRPATVPSQPGPRDGWSQSELKSKLSMLKQTYLNIGFMVTGLIKRF